MKNDIVDKNNCPLVLVEWLDSRQPVGQWQRLSEFEPVDSTRCASVGFLLYDGAAQKVLAPNMADIEDEQNIQASGIIHIPSVCVTRIVHLLEEND